MVNLITIGMARKDYESIQKYSEQLLTLRPHSQAALEGLATCSFQIAITKPRRACAQKLVEATPDHFERWFNLGVAEQKRANLGSGQGVWRSHPHPSRRQAGAREHGNRAAGIRRPGGFARIL